MVMMADQTLPVVPSAIAVNRPQIVPPSRKNTNGVVTGPVPHILSSINDLPPTLQKFRLDGKVAVVTG